LPVTDWTKAIVCAISASRSLIHFMGHTFVGAISAKLAVRIKKVPRGDCIFFPAARQWGMDAKTDRSDEAEGLRLVRAFLLLPPDKRAEAIAFVEGLARVQSRPEEGQGTSPT